MSEFVLPGTEEELAEYQRRVEEKNEADIQAQWRGQPRARKIFSVIVLILFLAGFAWILYSGFTFDMP